MKQMMRHAFAYIACVAIWWNVIHSQAIAQQGYAPRVGQAHPDLVLPQTDNGKAISLADYRGKKVLLIHFASW